MRSPGNRGYGFSRFRRWFLAWLAGTLALMVTGLVIDQTVNPGPPPPARMPISVPTPPWGDTSSPTPSAAPSSPAPPLTGPVQVLQGRQQVNGVSLGYPHSTAGAVSAADEFLTAIGSTLDPDRAAAVMRMTADPSYGDGPQQAAEGAANDRKNLGLPPGGPVPQGADFQVEPVEYQVRDVSADQATVLLLCDFISTVPAQGSQTRIGVFPMRMHWAEGDWKILAGTPADYENLRAEPASPRAAALGWQQLEPSGG